MYVLYNSVVYVLDVLISFYMNGDYVKFMVFFLFVFIDLFIVFNEYMYIGFLVVIGVGMV